MSLILYLLGAKVIGVSLKPKTTLNLYSLIKNFLYGDYIKDLNNYNNFEKLIIKHKPDVIFHLAAQALVIESYNNPYNTFTNNIIITLNLLEILRKINFKVTCIFITSDKVYKNIEINFGYKETSKLGGIDPYSASKSSIEVIIESYKKSYFYNKNNLRIAIARAGNVIGGGDWSENRLIPDAIKKWSINKKFNLRNPLSTRPWQHVLEPLMGYAMLAFLLNKRKSLNGEIFNFGPSKKNSISTYNLIEILGQNWFGKNFKSYITIKKTKSFKETDLLILNSKKAKLLLNWKCKLNYRQTILMTSKWYFIYYNNRKNIVNFTIKQIEEYLNKYVSK